MGKNPQSEEMIDDWRCAVALLPMLLVENAQMQRQTGAVMQDFRNDVVKSVINGIAAADMMHGRLIDGSRSRN
jgi:hypothetical protein